MVRFQINWAKAVQAIDLIAHDWPGVTQYYVGKIMFFADREHLLDFGRPISGDRYVAMGHGPVPSSIRDILRADSGYPDEILDMLNERVTIEHEGNKQHIYTKGSDDFPALSGSDIEYIHDSFGKYGSMGFWELKHISHEDNAYSAAWNKLGNANELDIKLWFDRFKNPEIVIAQAQENSKMAV